MPYSSFEDMTDKEYVEAVVGQTCTEDEIREFCNLWPNTAQSRADLFVQVAIPRIGTTCMYQDDVYVITSTSTYQEEASTPWNPTEPPSIVTICTILRVHTDGPQAGQDAGDPTKQVRSHELALVHP